MVTLHSLKDIDLVRISHERVDDRLQAVYAVNEKPDLDARSPGDRVPGHSSPLLCRNQSGEHAEECCSRERLRARHRRGAATASAHVGGGPFLADQFSRNHDEQLTYDNPPTSKNSDGFSL